MNSLLVVSVLAATLIPRTAGNDIRQAAQPSFQISPLNAVLVRTHVIDSFVSRRLSSIMDSVNPSGNNEPAPHTKYDVYLLYDEEALGNEQTVTRYLAQEGFNAKELGLRLFGLHLKSFTRYPGVKPNPISKSHYQHLGYAHWWDLQGRTAGNYSFIWCMEHDVGLTGSDWRTLFDSHLAMKYPSQEGGGDTDLLSWLVGWPPIPPPPPHGAAGWTLGCTKSSRFGQLRHVAIPELAVHFGPIIRLSSRLMEHIHINAVNGYLGHYEVAPTTLCNETSWCSIGNLSRAHVGVIAYKTPVNINSNVMAQLDRIAPGRLFHPARDTGSASSRVGVKNLNNLRRRKDEKVPSKASDVKAEYTAKCLMANPRPRRPSWGCLEGCPFHKQWVCDHVNCMADGSNGLYHHLAAGSCISKCQSKPEGCPYDVSVQEWAARSVFKPGDMTKALRVT